MGIGVSIFLIAVGSILAFAVDLGASQGIDLDTVGVILIILGLIGLAVDALFWSEATSPRRRTDVFVDDEPVVGQRLVDLDEPVVERRVVEVERPVAKRTTTSRVVYDDLP